MTAVLYNIIELSRLDFQHPYSLLCSLKIEIFTEFGGMCVGIIGFHSSGSSPTTGFKRYSAVKSMIGYPPVPATSQRMLAKIVDGFTHTLCRAGGGAADKKRYVTLR